MAKNFNNKPSSFQQSKQNILYGRHAVLSALANPKRQINKILCTKDNVDELSYFGRSLYNYVNNAEVKSNAVAFKGNKLNEDPENVNSDSNVSFKAGVPNKPGFFSKIKSFFSKLTDIIGEFMGKLYGKKLIESERMAKASAWLSDVPGGVTQAMATFGALLTSGTYVTRTLKNKDLEDDKKRTLAVLDNEKLNRLLLHILLIN